MHSIHLYVFFRFDDSYWLVHFLSLLMVRSKISVRVLFMFIVFYYFWLFWVPAEFRYEWRLRHWCFLSQQSLLAIWNYLRNNILIIIFCAFLSGCKYYPFILLIVMILILPFFYLFILVYTLLFLTGWSLHTKFTKCIQ